MATMDECIAELAALISGLETGGPILRIGRIDVVTATTVTVAGFDCVFLDVGVTPVVGRTGVYLRQGTNAVLVGMLAT